MLGDLEAVGYTPSEALRAGIRVLHRKEFPVYAQKAIAKKKTEDLTEGMSPEQICEQLLLGEVVEDGGVMVCRWKQDNITKQAPLTKIKEFLEE